MDIIIFISVRLAFLLLFVPSIVDYTYYIVLTYIYGPFEQLYYI